MIVCPYCKGGRFNRHDAPPGMSSEGWERITGPLGECALCKGAGKLSQDAFNAALVVDGTALLFASTKDGRSWFGCPRDGCRLWLDATVIFGRGERGIHVDDFRLRCPAGHETLIEITL